MRIVVFEAEHFEGAYPVIKLFDMPGNQIDVYTSKETEKRFLDLFGKDSERYRWTILPIGGKFHFFYSLLRNLKKDKPGILYLNTISDNHLLYAVVLWLLPLKRVILTVHDINCLFESKFAWNFRKAIIHIGKKWLVRQVSEFNVVAGPMVSYLQIKAGQKKVHNVPGAIYEYRSSIRSTASPIRIVVPGSLDEKRRDYLKVFELAALADQEKIYLEIILLGGPVGTYGKEIIWLSKNFFSSYCKILAYETPVVDQPEFDQKLDAADFIFIPSVINTKICGDIPEVYGKTKSSGNLFDIVKHAKPFIIPEALIIDDFLIPGSFRYHEPKEIIAFLLSIASNKILYDGLLDKAKLASLDYTVQKVRERNADVFLTA